MAEPGLIWKKNWTIAQVFTRCQWTVHLGFKNPWYFGISTQEIESVCRVMNLPRKEWVEILDYVRLMANAATPVLNEDRS